MTDSKLTRESSTEDVGFPVVGDVGLVDLPPNRGEAGRWDPFERVLPLGEVGRSPGKRGRGPTSSSSSSEPSLQTSDNLLSVRPMQSQK